MKSFVGILALAGLSAISAFQVPLATRAIAPKKKVVAKEAPKKAEPKKKVVAKKVAPKKKVVAKAVKKPPREGNKGPPESKGYPMFSLDIKFKNVSGGGNKAPALEFNVPNFADPKLQIKRDPAFYAAAAKTRTADTSVFDYDDGLTILERAQRKNSQKTFLTGQARSQIDDTAIRDDIDEAVVNSLFGLDPDRFQLLFIAIFGVFTLVGSLSGNLKL